MVISSWGRVTGGRARFSRRATAKEMLPTRPQYMRKIITAWLRGSRSRVIPVVMPAVPMAEKVSKSTSVRGMAWTALITRAPARARSRLV